VKPQRVFGIAVVVLIVEGTNFYNRAVASSSGPSASSKKQASLKALPRGLSPVGSVGGAPTGRLSYGLPQPSDKRLSRFELMGGVLYEPTAEAPRAEFD
jgi:hypothetical protein